MQYEFLSDAQTNLESSLAEPDGRDSLLSIKNWIEYFEDPSLFDVPPDVIPQVEQVSRVISRYAKVYVTASRYTLIDSAVAFVNKKIQEGDVHFKRTFENTVYVDNDALKKRFKSIYEPRVYLKRLKDVKIRDLDIEQTLQVAAFFKTVVSETRTHSLFGLMNKNEPTFKNLETRTATHFHHLTGHEF